MSNYYINPVEFHEEIRKCKLANKLSNKGVEFFYELARNKVRVYKFPNADDYEDAVSSAVLDCSKYWKNFKEGRVVRIGLARNFEKGDVIKIEIKNRKPIIIEAGKTFEIDKNINKSMINMVRAFEKRTISSCFVDEGSLGIYVDRTRSNITFMDIYNRLDMSQISNLSVKYKKKSTSFLKTEELEYEFNEPSNAFSYFTTIVTNGILKFNDKMYPKNQRDNKTIPMSHINSDANGLFNI